MRAIRFAVLPLGVALGACLWEPWAKPQPPVELAGNDWRLLELRLPPADPLVPDDPLKYALSFGRNGQVSARVDCNRQSGPWRTTPDGEIQIGPLLASTRAMCPASPITERFAQDLPRMTSYHVVGERLMLDAGRAQYLFERYDPRSSPR
jgi:heat shock protein HslJ